MDAGSDKSLRNYEKEDLPGVWRFGERDIPSKEIYISAFAFSLSKSNNIAHRCWLDCSFAAKNRSLLFLYPPSLS